jgi:hypothetical protein
MHNNNEENLPDSANRCGSGYQCAVRAFAGFKSMPGGSALCFCGCCHCYGAGLVDCESFHSHAPYTTMLSLWLPGHRMGGGWSVAAS